MLDTNLTSKEESVLRSLLSNLRSEANLRQVDLADRLGKPQSFVSKYESGERRLDLIELREICLVLEISLSDFVKRFESEIEWSRIQPFANVRRVSGPMFAVSASESDIR